MEQLVEKLAPAEQFVEGPGHFAVDHCDVVGADSASQDHSAKVWEATTGRELQTLGGHDGAVNGVAFDHAGRLLATCGRDGQVNLWGKSTDEQQQGASTQNPRPFTLRRTLHGQTAPVTALSFSRDDRRLASISDDGVVKLWDVASGQEVITLTPFGGGIAPYTVAFSSEGNLLAAARGHEVTLWGSSDPPDHLGTARTQESRRRAVAWHEQEAAVCANTKNRFAAEFHLNQVITLEPQEPTHYHRRGELYANWADADAGTADHREKALADYQRAVQLSGGWLFTGGGDYLMAPHIPFDQYEAFTIEAWVYGDFRNNIVGQGQSGDPENSIWFKGVTDSYGWESATGTEHHELSIEQPLPLQWNHIALVYDGTRQRLFANGELSQQKESPGPGPLNRKRMLIIGGHEGASRTSAGAGLLRSVRISKAAIYEFDFAPDEPLQADGDTVLLYEFDKNRDWMSDLKIPDLSGNGNDGTLQGRWWNGSAESR